MSGAWRSKRGPAKPPKKEDLVDLSTTFGISFGGGDGSDSSDTEFAPEDHSVDSEDSHEFEGDGGAEDDMDTKEMSDTAGVHSEERDDVLTDRPSPAEVASSEQLSGGNDDTTARSLEPEYNPLIVRRSQRAIKPTKDIDLYLLGAQYGVDVEGSDADSSDLEFAPEAISDAGSDTSSDSAVEEETKQSSSSKVVSDDEVSEQGATTQQYPASAQSFEIPLCSVCLEDSGEAGDLVECDKCGIAVHEGCYGIPEEEDHIRDNGSDLSSFTTIPWFCDACKAGISCSDCHCDLCPTKGGLFKQTINGRWVHVVCMLYTPNMEYMEPSLLSGVTLDQFPTSRWGNKSCQLCEDVRMSRTGICIGCDAGLCKSSFHVTCAQQHGLLCEVDSEEEAGNKEVCDPFFAHCKAHADKDVAKRKRRDYLTVIKKQRSFKFDESDERIQHYLEEAKIRYTKFFDKMQEYYQPERVYCGEERWLHTVPSALEKLTRKAKLLGHVSEEVETVSRRKIAPGLTVDFVDYFNARQNQIQALLTQQENLNSAHQHLEKEQEAVKVQLDAVQRTLARLRVTGQATLSKVNLLHLNLSKLGLVQNLELPHFIEESGEVEEGLPQCSVCDTAENQHLMALCDTCNKHYHIGCLDPPLTKVPKKSNKWSWQCHNCCRSSGDELAPVMANFDEPSSRSGRKIKIPKVLSYPNYQVQKQAKKRKRK